MKKKLLFAFVALLTTASAWADVWQDPETKVNYEYTVGESEASVKGGELETGSPDATGAITILQKFSVDDKEYTVTSIGNSAFKGRTGLTSVSIPSSVTSIGWYAFSHCSSLTSITIPSSVTSIGGGAFSGCSSLTSIIVEEGNSTYDSRENCNAIIETATNTLIHGCNKTVILSSITSIGKYAFQECTGLTSVSIPSSVTSIGSRTFWGCSGLTSVSIPSSVTSIGDSAFYNCKNLSSINIPNSVTTIGKDVFSGCKGLVSITIPESVTSIGGSAFRGCTGLTSITIPSSVTEIRFYAFYGCTGLTSITIPSSVTTIGTAAFSSCAGLTSITVDAENKIFDSRGDCNAIIETATNTLLYGCSSTVIPNDVTNIGAAFYGCTGLTSITIPSSVTTIGTSAFKYCTGLTSITIPNSVTEIGSSAFYGCTKLTSITIPSSVTSIGRDAFRDCKALTSITIPESVKTIDTSTFSSCTGLTSIYIPESVKTIGNQAFWGCTGLTSIIIPSSVTRIGDEAFYKCSNLKNVTIPSSVTSIGRSAFSSCTSLTSITIPESVTSIKDNAFESCDNLTTVISYIEEPFSLNSTCFSTYSSSTLYVSVGTKAKYEAADGWKEFKNIVEFSNASVTLTKEMETFAYALPLDFTTPVSGLKAYTVKEVSDGKAVLEEVTGAVPAGTGLILKGTAGETYELPYATKAPLPVENKLVGVLADTEIGGNDVDYILQDGKFVKAVAGTLKAGKAYLKLDAALAREIIEIDGETTGISLVENGKRETENVFDLQGRRVSKPSKGMYIVNGKKVVMN